MRAEFYPHGHIQIEGFTYAKAHHIDSGKPYSVWQAPGQPDWWTVLDSQGKNVLVYISESRYCGFNFTSKEHAEQILKEWNL